MLCKLMGAAIDWPGVVSMAEFNAFWPGFADLQLRGTPHVAASATYPRRALRLADPCLPGRLPLKRRQNHTRRRLYRPSPQPVIVSPGPPSGMLGRMALLYHAHGNTLVLVPPPPHDSSPTIMARQPVDHPSSLMLLLFSNAPHYTRPARE